MERFIVIALVLSLTFSSCATVADVSHYSADDPFTEQLDLLDRKLKGNEEWLLFEAISLAVSFAAASTFQTLNSLGVVDKSTSQYIVIPFSISAVLFGGLSVYELIDWKKNTESYLQTVRLQAQYNNLIYGTARP